MSKSWIVIIAPIFFYGTTTLTQYGFNSYFNIPSSLTESSLKGNFIYFFQLFQMGFSIIGLMRWWMWVVLILVILIIFSFFVSNSFWRKFLTFLSILLFGGIVYGSYNFGILAAKNAAEFYVPSAGCISLDKNISYIIPNFYEGRAILVPIDSTRKISGGIVVKDLSELGCAIEKKNIGTIIK